MNNYEKINLILSDWDPVGVGHPMSLDEYKKYIPRIIQVLNNEEELERCLINIIEKELGLEYPRESNLHIYDLKDLVKKLMGDPK